MKIKAVLVSVCFMMAATNSVFANNDNECNTSFMTNVLKKSDETAAMKSSCTVTLIINNKPYSASYTCECDQKEACGGASNFAFLEAINVFRND